jgi:hypothetical protein
MHDVPVPGRIKEDGPLASPSGYARKMDIVLKKRPLCTTVETIKAHGMLATFDRTQQLINSLRVSWCGSTL